MHIQFAACIIMACYIGNAADEFDTVILYYNRYIFYAYSYMCITMYMYYIGGLKLPPI